jgi:large subunit ribosomal protein L22e
LAQWLGANAGFEKEQVLVKKFSPLDINCRAPTIVYLFLLFLLYTTFTMAPTKINSATIKKTKVVVDCSAPANDKIFDVAAFEKYLHDRIKVDGRTNNLGEAIAITRSDNKVTIVANIAFSKRYVKYLTKKFLKKNQIRDWLRVIATDKQTFTLRYFNIANDDEEADEE